MKFFKCIIYFSERVYYRKVCIKQLTALIYLVKSNVNYTKRI